MKNIDHESIRKKIPFLLITLAILITASACSLRELAVDLVIDALSGAGSGSALTGDDDPEFVGDALPFALKLYEILLAEAPDNDGLLLTTGTGFIMYANAFLQTPADILADEDYELRLHLRERAKNMYLRGRDYVINAIEVLHPGFEQAVLDGDIGEYLSQMGEEDIPYMYWAGLGWMGAVSIDSFDVRLGLTREMAFSILERALEIDETYSDGAIHEFFISYYGGLPEILGGSEEKARFHFEKAVELSRGTKPGPYVALATAVTVKNQNADEFRDLLGAALAVEIVDPDTQLVTIVTQRKAQWLLDNIDRFFLVF